MTPGGFTSKDVEYLKYVPFEIGTATGARIVGKHLYVTSWRSFSIYDVSDPENPKLESTTPFGFRFENEDVTTNGKLLFFSEELPNDRLHVYDVSDKKNPTEIAIRLGRVDRRPHRSPQAHEVGRQLAQGHRAARRRSRRQRDPPRATRTPARS